MTVQPEIDKRNQVPRFSCVGVVLAPGAVGVFPVVQAALRAQGVRVVVRVDAAALATPDTGGPRAWLAGVDRALSPLLPGSRPPALAVAPVVAVSLEALSPTTVFDGLPLEALIVVGPVARLAGRLLGLAPVVHELALGCTADCAAGRFGFSETVQGLPVVMLRLRQLFADGASRTWAEGAVQTHLASVSHTKAAVLAFLPSFLDAALRRDDAGVDTAAAPVRAVAVNIDTVVRHAMRMLRAIADRACNRFQWIMAVMPAPVDGAALDWRGLRALVPPADRFWADPFLVVREGQTWLFFEEAPFQSPKGSGIGHISVAPLGADGRMGPVQRVLDLPWHLSYPNVFEHEGDWYMIPESGSRKRVELYRCTRWPDAWTHHATLLDGYAGYDASMLDDAGRFWMFVARRAPGSSTADQLDLFSAASPLGPWSLHPDSPVVVDVRFARPGGRPFRHGGRWIRPTQDSSGGIYGRALRFQRVTTVGAGHREETEHLVEPNRDGGILGIHSYATAGGWVVVDLCRKVSRVKALRRFQRPLPDVLVSTTWRLPDGL